MIRPIASIPLLLLLLTPGTAALAQEVARIDVEPAEIVVAAGDTVRLDLAAYDAEGEVVENARFQLFVNPFTLGKFLEDGRFVAGPPAEGQLAVRAGSGAAIGRAEITITEPPPATIEIDPLPERVAAGSVVPLSAVARSAAGTAVGDGERIRWSTDDSDVATVDPLGNLVTHRPGQVTVTARMADGPSRLATGERTPAAPGGPAGTASMTVVSAPGGRLRVTGPGRLETGDVARYRLGGEAVHPRWTVTPDGAQIDMDGRFVASRPGTYLIRAELGDRVAQHAVTAEPRAVRRELALVGRGPVTDRLTGDLVVFTGVDGNDYAYLGTAQSNAVLVFDVTDPARPVLTDSVTTDARMVLDVKVNPDRTLAVFSREGAADRANGIVLLDLSDPAHPVPVGEFTETVGGGVHNTFFDGDHVYATHSGDGALHVIDVSDPRNPVEVAEWHTDTPGRYLHDVFVKDGVAYLAYWADGLVILDVGGAGRGGSPANPVEIGRLVYDAVALYGPGGGGPRGTHSVFVDGDRAYVGDEVYPPVFDLEKPIQPRGYIHVVDVSDLANPREVARYEVPEAGAHNHWVEGGTLYSSYYQGGVRVVDVTGEVKGDLYDQGREIAAYVTDAADQAFLNNRAFAFGAQLHDGRLFVSDMSSGLWIFELTGEPRSEYPAE